MRLLIINYAMDRNSDVFAWQAAVARELADSCDDVLVLTEQIGEYAAAPNMQVLPLIDQQRYPLRKGARIAFINARIALLAWQHRSEVCFIHMAANWAFLAAPALRLLRLPVLMWYAHGRVTWQLRLAHQCVNRVVTSTVTAFRVPSTKVRIIGQGVDTDLFTIPAYTAERHAILYVGRISRVKRIDLMIETMEQLHRIDATLPIRLKLIGPTITDEDGAYEQYLRQQIWEHGLQNRIEFVGFVPQRAIPELYRQAWLHLNLSETGSMDKTVLEALSCGCPVLTSNPAFNELLSNYPEMYLTDVHSQAIAERIYQMYITQPYQPEALRGLICGQHDQRSYVQRILLNLQEMCA